MHLVETHFGGNLAGFATGLEIVSKGYWTVAARGIRFCPC